MVAAAVGGTVSRITGGKFANGAVSAAFTHLFNNEGGNLKVLFARGTYLGMNIRDHSALYLSYEEGDTPRELLFDPDGGYTQKSGVRGQIYSEGDFLLDGYFKYHESLKGSQKTDVLEYNLTTDQVKRLRSGIENYPLAESFSCATSVGNVLKSIEPF